MLLKIEKSKAIGTLKAQPSKSFLHRALICAALCDGKSTIRNISLSDDIKATVSCLKALGASIAFDGDAAVVTGIGNARKNKNAELFCNESGSTLRFLIPLSYILCDTASFTGAESLMKRPQSVYEELFSRECCSFKADGKTVKTVGELKPGAYSMRGDVSSQFITGLMLALPLLNGDSKIILTTKLESEPYVNITIAVLKLFGVSVKRTGDNEFLINGNQKFKPCDVVTEGDWSNAAFPESFNLAGGSVLVTGLSDESAQGDKVCRELFKKLIVSSPGIDISDCPDLGPVLFSAAALLNGASFSGTRRLSIKESNRTAAMKDELKKFGVEIIVNENSVFIPKATLQKPRDVINCHNDHRIAMALTLLLSVTGGELQGAECVNKSYPGFFEDMKKCGVNIANVE